MAKISLDIIANINSAVKNVESFSKQSVNSINKIDKSLNLLKIGFAGVVGAFAFNKIKSGFDTIIDAAEKQEDAINNLNQQMKLAGTFSESASQSMQEFAKEIQRTSKIGDETALSALGLAQTFGKSTEETQKLVKAAVELSAATGLTLEGSVKNLGKTYAGLTGELGESLPIIRTLTAEQLKSGAALDLIINRFGGSAAAQLKTYSGAVAATSNAFGDLLEPIGGLITQNPLVISAIGKLGDLFRSLEKIVTENKSVFTDFINAGIIGFANVIPIAIDALGFFDFALVSAANAARSLGSAFIEAKGFITGDDVSNEVSKIDQAIKESQTSLENRTTILVRIRDATTNYIQGLEKQAQAERKVANSNIAEVNEAASRSAKQAAVDIKQVIKELDNLSNQLKDVGLTEIQILERTKTERLRILNEALKTEQVNRTQFLELQSKIELDFAKKTAEATAKIAEESRKKQIGAVQDLNNLITGQQRNVGPGGGNFQDLSAGQQVGAGAAAAVNQALKGAQGATQLISGVIGTIADTLLPGIGSIVSQVFSVLAQGPEKVKEFITQFIQAIPVIIENIILAIPALLEALFEQIPVLITKLAENLPKIIEGLIQGLLNLISDNRFAVQLALAAQKFVIALVVEVPKITRKLTIEFIKNIPTIIENMAKGAIEGFKEAFKSIGNIFTGGGDTGGLFGGGGFLGLGFAQGGLVPSGFPNDTFPARLTSGEFVIDRSTTTRLNRFLDLAERQGSSQAEPQTTQQETRQSLTINLQLGQRELAQVLLDLDRNGFRVSA